jgi:hypothetical protein
LAEEEAYLAAGVYKGNMPALEWVDTWNRAFHESMDRLARARGLR